MTRPHKIPSQPAHSHFALTTKEIDALVDSIATERQLRKHIDMAFDGKGDGTKILPSLLTYPGDDLREERLKKVWKMVRQRDIIAPGNLADRLDKTFPESDTSGKWSSYRAHVMKQLELATRELTKSVLDGWDETFEARNTANRITEEMAKIRRVSAEKPGHAIKEKERDIIVDKVREQLFASRRRIEHDIAKDMVRRMIIEMPECGENTEKKIKRVIAEEAPTALLSFRNDIAAIAVNLVSPVTSKSQSLVNH